MMLADLGADVIVIHRPQTDHPTASSANLLDRGKKSIVLDLNDEADKSVARSLVASADTLIEGFRPGVMERLGLGPDDMGRVNPRLVYGRMTGWGQTGPRSQTAAHDLNYIATSGALWYASEPGSSPFTPPTMLGDIGGGALYLVAGVLAGLLKVARTEQGTVVDAAIVDGSAHMMALLMSMAPSGNLKDGRGESLLDGPHWSRCYECADCRHLSVQCLEPKFYRPFLEIMELAEDPAFSKQYEPSLWPELSKRLADMFLQQPLHVWAKKFAGTEACVAPVLSPNEAARDAHTMHREVWLMHDGIQQPAPAPRFDGRAFPAGEIPTRGQHSEEIRRDLAASNQEG